MNGYTPVMSSSPTTIPLRDMYRTHTVQNGVITELTPWVQSFLQTLNIFGINTFDSQVIISDECKVDFSKYQTSLEVWRGGAVPMDILTTESVVSLYFAASIIADDDSEVNQLIEECVEAL